MKIVLFYVLLIIPFIAEAQTITQTRYLDSTALASKKPELLAGFGYKKKMPAEFELSILTALSYLPDLDSTEIIFKMSKIGTSLNARPKFGSGLFRRGFKRKYVVRICPPKSDSSVTLDQASFNAQVGVFGHELSHLVDYSHHSFFGILKRALAYLTSKSKEKYEKLVDQMTIDCGLGWQLHDWSAFVVDESNGTEKYKKFKRKIYLEPAEIIQIIEDNGGE